MKKEQKEQVVEELTQRLKAADTLLVADYRGLTMPQIDELRTRLLESGARFAVVKNTLTRRAAEAAGTDALLTLLDGPSAIAFLEADGDMGAAEEAPADEAPAEVEQAAEEESAEDTTKADATASAAEEEEPEAAEETQEES